METNDIPYITVRKLETLTQNEELMASSSYLSPYINDHALDKPSTVISFGNVMKKYQRTGRHFCVAKNATTNELYFTLCKTRTGEYKPNLLKVYTNPTARVIHEYGYPYMCFTGRFKKENASISPGVFMEPCEPCAIGTQAHIPCAKTSVSQWLKSNVSNVFPSLTVHPFIPGLCLTNTTDATIYSACDSCIWEHENLAIGNEKRSKYKQVCLKAFGIQQFVCNSFSFAELFNTSKKTPNELCDTYRSSPNTNISLDGQQFGLGAIFNCNSQKWITKGYGYFTHELITAFGVNEITHAQTQKIVIQPYDATNFDVAAQGHQIINISTYTNMFGKAYEANIFAAPPQAKPAFLAINIVLAIINTCLIFLHIGLTIYENELKQKFASPAIE